MNPWEYLSKHSEESTCPEGCQCSGGSTEALILRKSLIGHLPPVQTTTDLLLHESIQGYLKVLLGWTLSSFLYRGAHSIILWNSTFKASALSD
jgi:hypothetical protein